MSNTDNVDYLPIWKKDSTAEEFMLELSLVARKHPERFARAVVVMVEDHGDSVETRYHYRGVDTMGLIGLLEMGKCEVWAKARGLD